MSDAYNAIPLLKDRVAAYAVESPFMSKRDRFWEASMDLWCAEMDAYKALSDVGLYRAAECAWKRRSAASELCHILTRCS